MYVMLPTASHMAKQEEVTNTLKTCILRPLQNQWQIYVRQPATATALHKNSAQQCP